MANYNLARTPKKACIPPAYNTIAYQEFYNTKGKSAFNFTAIPASVKTLNQYFKRYTFIDGSYLDISSNRCKVDLNIMKVYNAEGVHHAVRTLF